MSKTSQKKEVKKTPKKPKHITKQIFVTGGVVSSLGKGITASSLGRLFKSRGFNVRMQKLDPYINVDPGTMNPFQHGEVFVTDDGAETDLDIGHYERFLDENFDQNSNHTTGKIYSTVIERERKGEYLGQTVQVIPHITNEIKKQMRSQAGNDVDLIITEIGGTVGDIESQPFIEAAREIRSELGWENVRFVHVSLVPFIESAHEIKTKPTQHSVQNLRMLGIVPDALVIRSSVPVPDDHKQKIALMTGVNEKGVIRCPDVDSLYKVPQVLLDEGLDQYLLEKFELKSPKLNLKDWEKILNKINKIKNNPKSKKITVALVGKYIDVQDAYLSVVEAIKHAGINNEVEISIKWIASDDLNNYDEAKKILADVQAIVIPGGFGVRGIEGKLNAIRYARENKVPILGLCLGLQSMVIEFARNVLKLEDADSTEFNKNTKNPVIATMDEQKEIIKSGNLGGTMRLGAYEAVLKPNSLAAKTYQSTKVSERHRHRYEVNNKYRDILEKNGLIISGTSPDKNHQLVEFVELENHPYFIGTQAHPELKSRPTNPHPLFDGLIRAAAK